MKIPQVRDPNLPPLEELPESYHAKVNPLLSLSASHFFFLLFSCNFKLRVLFLPVWWFAVHAGCVVWLWPSVHQLCNIPSTTRLPGSHHLWEVWLHWGTQVSGTCLSIPLLFCICLSISLYTTAYTSVYHCIHVCLSISLYTTAYTFSIPLYMPQYISVYHCIHLSIPLYMPQYISVYHCMCLEISILTTIKRTYVNDSW